MLSFAGWSCCWGKIEFTYRKLLLFCTICLLFCIWFWHKIVENYLTFSEHNLNTHNYGAIILGDFNVPKYRRLKGTPMSNCCYCNKTKAYLFQGNSCVSGVNQLNNSLPNITLLDPVFKNICNLRFSVSNYPTVTQDIWGIPLILDFQTTSHCHPIALTQRS
jgi:hypothetical protein